MCDPMSIASATLTGVSQIASYRADVTQTKQQNAYNEQSRIAAGEATAQGYVQTQQRLLQEGEANAANKFQVAQDTRAAQATALMAAGEGGVGGFSVTNLINQFAAQQGAYNSSIDRQQQWSADQAALNMRGVEAQGQDRINSAPAVARPSFLGAALRIGGAGLSSYTDYKQRQQEQGY